MLAITKYGELEGKEEEGFIAFNGIPYAKPPLGELRFAPPEPPEYQDGVRSCKKYGAPALQFLTLDHVTQAKILKGSSEDCLYLNIKTPARVKEINGRKYIDKEAGLPVYVFVHGGAYETGGGNMSLYRGENFARQGIVYVNINYRLAAFGAFALKTLETESGTTGNYQILDVVQAMRWIHENIEFFGGNPNNITLGGESAGAFSVSVLMGLPSMEGMFQRCILESGAITGVTPAARYGHGNPEKMFNESLSVARDLNADDSKIGLERLRSLPAEQILKAWFYRQDGSPRMIKSDPMLKNLMFEQDETPNPYSGYINKVDLLFGFNTDEGSMFADPAITEDNYLKFIMAVFPEDYKTISQNYCVDSENSPYKRMAELIGLMSFKGSMIPYGDVLSKAGKNVYAYQFDYLTEKLRQEGLGVRHIAELNMVFNKHLDWIGADDEEGHAAAEFMNTAWSNFIKYGNPNGISDSDEKNVSVSDEKNTNVDYGTGSEPFTGNPEWARYDEENRNAFKISRQSMANCRIPEAEEMIYLQKLIIKENK